MNDICPKSEYEPRFWQRMLRSMAMSFHKYGKLKDAYPHRYNAIATLKLS